MVFVEKGADQINLPSYRHREAYSSALSPMWCEVLLRFAAPEAAKKISVLFEIFCLR